MSPIDGWWHVLGVVLFIVNLLLLVAFIVIVKIEAENFQEYRRVVRTNGMKSSRYQRQQLRTSRYSVIYGSVVIVGLLAVAVLFPFATMR